MLKKIKDKLWWTWFWWHLDIKRWLKVMGFLLLLAAMFVKMPLEVWQGANDQNRRQALKQLSDYYQSENPRCQEVTIKVLADTSDGYVYFMVECTKYDKDISIF